MNDKNCFIYELQRDPIVILPTDPIILSSDSDGEEEECVPLPPPLQPPSPKKPSRKGKSKTAAVPQSQPLISKIFTDRPKRTLPKQKLDQPCGTATSSVGPTAATHLSVREVDVTAAGVRAIVNTSHRPTTTNLIGSGRDGRTKNHGFIRAEEVPNRKSSTNSVEDGQVAGPSRRTANRQQRQQKSSNMDDNMEEVAGPARKRPKQHVSHAQLEHAITAAVETTMQTATDRRARENSAQKKNTPPTTQPDANGNYYAITENEECQVNFLNHTMKKIETKYLCPFPNKKGQPCGIPCTTFTALRKHFANKHNKEQKELLKPQDSDPNNWRRVQNANSRFKISTVKLKLSSILNGGNSVLNANATQSAEDVMAKEVVEILNKHAVELSKLAIVFSHLIYFKVYNAVERLSDDEVDAVFRTQPEWDLIMIKFKTFIRRTENSDLSKTNKTTGTKKGIFASLEDSEFFEMCEQYDVQTSFEQFSQNAWINIAQLFSTNFKNNILTHLYQRIRNWLHFKLLDGKKNKEVRGKENRKNIGEKVYHTMKYLFHPNESARPEHIETKLISELQHICKFPDFKKMGSHYFSRLYYNFEDTDDDSNTKKGKPPAKKEKPPAKKRKVNSKNGKTKKSPPKTQNNGPRLLWHQMVPAMIRLQRWISTTNSKRLEESAASHVSKKKRRKRKRKRQRKAETTECNQHVQPQQHKFVKETAKPCKQRKKTTRRGKKEVEDDGEQIFHAKLKNFVVVPQHKFKLMHFAIDSKALYDIVKQLSAFRPKDKPLYTQVEFLDLIADTENANCKTINPFWHFVFNVTKLQTATKAFGGRITTNSSDVSVQMCKLKPGKQMTKEQLIELAKTKKRKAEHSDSESDSDADSDADDDEDK